jgi:hypothetical protein
MDFPELRSPHSGPGFSWSWDIAYADQRFLRGPIGLKQQIFGADEQVPTERATRLAALRNRAVADLNRRNGNQMHKLLTLALLLLAASTFQTAAQENQTRRTRVAQLTGMTCFLTGEQMSGMNKICYYDCAGSSAAITVSSVSLCPLTIQGR